MGQRASEQTVNLPALITREATFVPGTVNEEERTVELTWTTGARVLRGFWDRYWEELSLDPKHVRMKRLNNGAPLLNGHCGLTECVIGVVEEARLEAKRGWAKVRFAKAEDDPEADKIFRKVKDGILQKISVGYSTYKMEKIEDGDDKLPVYRATDWEPYELSVVAMGADDGAGFRSKESNNQNTTPCVFVTPRSTATVTRTKEKVMADTDDTTDTNESLAVAATRAVNQQRIAKAKEIAEAAEAAKQEAIAAERERAAGIKLVARQTKLGSTWAEKMIELNVSVEEARTAALKQIADEPDEIDGRTGLRILAGDDARDKFVRGASAWIFESTGQRKLLEQAKAKDPEAFADVSFDGGEFRGLSPLELARVSLERQGIKTRGLGKLDMIGLAFTHRSGLQTTGDFPMMLENAVGKVLLGAYATQETTWEQFCGTDVVPDFRASGRFRTGALPSLQTVAEHGEYKNAVIPDAAKFAISTERKGQIFGLSQETIINDDMGALINLAIEIGRASGRTLEENVWALLAENGGLGPTMADGQPFFHAANRANVNTTASALTVAGLDADGVVMNAQKDPSGKSFLNLNPDILVVPRALRGTADVINDSQYDPDTANKLQRKNAVYKMFSKIIGTPYLAANTTRRYLFCNPAIAAALYVVYLEGYGRGPIMQTKDGWRIDGVEWKVSLFAKAQVGDPKGAVTNAGQ